MEIIVDSEIVFNGKKYKGTCIICKHAIPYLEENKVVCTYDIDLRRVDTIDGKPSWCPLIKRSELDYIKSC